MNTLEESLHHNHLQDQQQQNHNRYLQLQALEGSSSWFYAPLMPCETRRTDVQGLTRPYNTVYVAKYQVFARFLTPRGAQTSLIYLYTWLAYILWQPWLVLCKLIYELFLR
jgi:hypothetical protein